jgi:hypothetical protein
MPRPHRWPIVVALIVVGLPVLYFGAWFAFLFASGAGWVSDPMADRIVVVWKPMEPYLNSGTPGAHRLLQLIYSVRDLGRSFAGRP